MQHAGENNTPIQGSVLYGTCNGAIGRFFVSSTCRGYEVINNLLGEIVLCGPYRVTCLTSITL